MIADLIPRDCGCVVKTRDGLLHVVCETHAANSPPGRLGLKRMSPDVPRVDYDALELIADGRGSTPSEEARRAIAEYVVAFNRGQGEL